MVDEQKIKSPDDEYQFPQDEYVSPETEGHASSATESAFVQAKAATSGSAGKLAKFTKIMSESKNKRIIAVVAVVIIVIIGIRLFHTKAVVVTTLQSQPVAQVQARVIEQQPSDNGMLDSLQGETSRTDSKIKDLQSQIADMQNSIDQSQAANQALQRSVAALSTQVQNLSAQLEKALEKAQPKEKRIVFHLRAVLPDRAWITSNTGETLSVTVGDPVTQYGKVRAIDARHGVIETSSGRKIGYGPNDY